MAIKQKSSFYKLILAWISYFLFISTISPSYLVEGSRNHLGFDFSSKENYVYTVWFVDFIYFFLFLLLLIITFLFIKTEIKK